MLLTDLLHGVVFNQQQLLERSTLCLQGRYLFIGHYTQMYGNQRRPTLHVFDVYRKCEAHIGIDGVLSGSRTWYVFQFNQNEYLLSMFQPYNLDKFLLAQFDSDVGLLRVTDGLLGTQNSPDRLFVGGAQWGDQVFIVHQLYIEGHGSCHEMHRIDCANKTYNTEVMTHLPLGQLAMIAINDTLVVIAEENYKDEPITECLMIDVTTDVYKLHVTKLEPDSAVGYPCGSRIQVGVCKGTMYLTLIPDDDHRLPVNTEVSDTFPLLGCHQLWSLDLDYLTWHYLGSYPTDRLDYHTRFSVSEHGQALLYRPTTVYVRTPQLFACYVHVPTLRYLAKKALLSI